ncbi:MULTISPECIES: pilus assembly protein PilP [Tepidiphilus]|jgi:type IV pilus assembly protein PilP|uniref:Pilus assembly protein PilP n=1 Tax=Tepidiphilus baoligensis TaxID=2698687 RepID=A0ABX1QME6_9PROT|nr:MULTISPECIES: pilus assembly protein PilP [Tepidiphilus]NMH17122.1 pilus assembly protein PilP [Tepidiphilus baoligensis]
MNFPSVRSTLPALISATLLVACVEAPPSGVADIEQWMQESSKGMKGRVPPLPEVHPFPSIAYAAYDLPDPFDPGRLAPPALKSATGSGLPAPDMTRPREPLERFSLSELRLRGVLRKGSEIRALIEAPDGVYPVGVGAYLGQNFGRVVNIQETKVTIEEMVREADQWVKRTAELNLEEKP